MKARRGRWSARGVRGRSARRRWMRRGCVSRRGFGSLTRRCWRRVLRSASVARNRAWRACWRRACWAGARSVAGRRCCTSRRPALACLGWGDGACRACSISASTSWRPCVWWWRWSAVHELAHHLVRHDRRDDDLALDYAAEELVVEFVVFRPARSIRGLSAGRSVGDGCHRRRDAAGCGQACATRVAVNARSSMNIQTAA